MWDCGRISNVRVASAVTSVLAEVHGTSSTGRSSMSVPTSGMGGTVTRVLLSRKCVADCAMRSSNGRNMVRVILGCNRGGSRVVAKVHEISGPNLHVCAGMRSVPGIGGNLNVTVLSASGNVVASGTTHGTGINNRILTFI